MVLRPRLAALLLAGLAAAAPTQGCTMPPKCFTGRAGWYFPTPERVRPHLTHGEAGRRIYDALIDGDRDRVLAMLRDDPTLARLQVRYDERGDRPDGQHGDLLTFAVTGCDEPMLAALLRAGVSPDGAERGRALEWALAADEPTMAELLLGAGASPDPQKQGGRDVFSSVAAAGNVGAAAMLVRHGLDLGWVDRFGAGHLETALDMESFSVAEVLANAGAPLWRVSMGGHLPVHSLLEARVLDKPGEDAAQRRLLDKARRPGLPWPPPPPPEVAAKVVSGEWPSPAQRAAGMVVTPEGLADLRARASTAR